MSEAPIRLVTEAPRARLLRRGNFLSQRPARPCGGCGRQEQRRCARGHIQAEGHTEHRRAADSTEPCEARPEGHHEARRLAEEEREIERAERGPGGPLQAEESPAHYGGKRAEEPDHERAHQREEAHLRKFASRALPLHRLDEKQRPANRAWLDEAEEAKSQRQPGARER